MQLTLCAVFVVLIQSLEAVRFSDETCPPCNCPQPSPEKRTTPARSPTQPPSGPQPNSAEKRELLTLHNQYRQQVAKGLVSRQPASNKIKDLQWSMELEQMAQRHSDKCQFGHDSNRKTSQWSWVGQNIAFSSNVAQNVKMWFDEHKDYNYQRNSCTDVCGHYTQLVWAKTTHIGCGVSKCNMSGFNAVYVVCNYGPGGNFNGESPY